MTIYLTHNDQTVARPVTRTWPILQVALLHPIRILRRRERSPR